MRTVLICDDSMFMRATIRRILDDAGFEVAGEATTGEEAVEQYTRHRPDLVTMDILMPGLNGVDAATKILTFDADARILICTAVGQDSLKHQAEAAGVKAFVTKPFEPSALLEALQQAVE